MPWDSSPLVGLCRFSWAGRRHLAHRWRWICVHIGPIKTREKLLVGRSTKIDLAPMINPSLEELIYNTSNNSTAFNRYGMLKYIDELCSVLAISLENNAWTYFVGSLGWGV